MPTLLTDEVRAWVGRTATYTAPEPLGRAAIRYFALAVGDRDRRWTDDAHARAHGLPGVVAPPTLVCETNQYVAGRGRDDDGYLGHTWPLPLPPHRMLRGGHDYRFHRPVTPDDLLTVTWRLDAVDERTASDGRPLLVATAHATYRHEGGDVLAENTETLLYQPTGGAAPDGGTAATEPGQGAAASAGGAAGVGVPEAPDGSRPVPDLVRRVELADMVAYGGATWDWHRLHYDAAYAAGRGLPGPVVDGQMLGAFLASHALGAGGPWARLDRLHFRLRGVVSPGEQVRCAGAVTGTAVDGDDLVLHLVQRVLAGGRTVAAPAGAEVRVPRAHAPATA